MEELEGNTKGQNATLRLCYVYEIRVDGVVRYIGKGRNDRIYSHLIDAKRTAIRSDVKIRNLFPHFRKMLVSAVRRGSNIAEKIVASNLTDGEAYKVEWQMIRNYHKSARWPVVEHDRRARHGSKGFTERMVEPGLSSIPTATTIE
jgi:hypothetical protein